MFLPGFSFDKTNLQFIYTQTKLWWLGFCIFGTLTICFIGQRISISYTNFMIANQLGVLGILNIFIIYSVFRKRYKIVQIFNKFILVENIVKNLTKSCISYSSIILFIKVLLIERFLSAIIAAAFDIETETLFKMHVVYYHFIENYQFSVELMLFIFYLFLRKFYELLDEFLEKKPKLLFKVEKAVVLLDEVFDQISMTFQSIILTKTLIQVCVLTVSLYYAILQINYLNFALTAVLCFNNEVQVTCSIIVFVQIVCSQRRKLRETLDFLYANLATKKESAYKKVW